jgi:hypothetical protein
MEGAMSSLKGMPRDLMPLFEEIVGDADPELLTSILRTQHPTLDERKRVEDVLAREFSRHLRPDWEPTAHGKRVDDVLGKFLLQFQFDEP